MPSIKQSRPDCPETVLPVKWQSSEETQNNPKETGSYAETVQRVNVICFECGKNGEHHIGQKADARQSEEKYPLRRDVIPVIKAKK